MNMKLNRIRAVLAGVMVLNGVAGCMVAVGDVTKVARHLTYPPDFRYIQRDEIQGAMWQLALHAREVNRLVQVDGAVESNRDDIVNHLRGMEAAASALDAGGHPTNHPVLATHLPRLRVDVQSARLAAEREPPNFFLAATVSGSCLPCHSGQP